MEVFGLWLVWVLTPLAIVVLTSWATVQWFHRRWPRGYVPQRLLPPHRHVYPDGAVHVCSNHCFEDIHDSCPLCGGLILRSGPLRRPGEMIRCSACLMHWRWRDD